MYSTITLYVNLLVKNILIVTKQEKYLDIEVATQSEIAFLTNKDRKEFYASNDRHY